MFISGRWLTPCQRKQTREKPGWVQALSLSTVRSITTSINQFLPNKTTFFHRRHFYSYNARSCIWIELKLAMSATIHWFFFSSSLSLVATAFVLSLDQTHRVLISYICDSPRFRAQHIHNHVFRRPYRPIHHIWEPFGFFPQGRKEARLYSKWKRYQSSQLAT